MGSFLTKYIMFEPNKYRGVIFDGTEDLQNLKGNWLVFSKMTWGIWQIFTRALGKSKNWDFDGILLSKEEMHKLKIYRGVMCHDSEERCKIWTGISLSLQNWHEEFGEFLIQHSKVSKFAL